jgi:transketolase
VAELDFDAMKADCLRLRNTIIDMIHSAHSGHSGGSLSSVEILWTLYNAVMNVRPNQPDWPDRDRFVLSKGHAAPALYTVLAEKGFFDVEALKSLRRAGAILQGHPDMRKVPGVDMSTGSLGMGISAGVGMALAARLSKKDYRVYVLVGDGELQEGQNWEAMMAAHKFRLGNLVVIVDRNGVQLDGPTEEIMPMLDIGAKMREFGWQVGNCDGHDPRSVYEALLGARDAEGGPRAIIADTVKGKGVSFMEGQSAWHGAPITDEHYKVAKSDLREER